VSRKPLLANRNVVDGPPLLDSVQFKTLQVPSPSRGDCLGAQALLGLTQAGIPSVVFP